MRLLNLPVSVQKMIRIGDLSAGAARTLVTADNPEKLAKKIVEEGLSVRAAEKLVQKKPSIRASSAPRTTKDQDTLALEGDLTAAIGMKVSINHKGENGSITIAYGHLDQLDDICRKLTKQVIQGTAEDDSFTGDPEAALDEEFQ